MHGFNVVALVLASVQAVGAFDEKFGAGGPFRAAEETDFIFRAYRLGVAVEYVPDMAVKHFHGRRTRQEIHSLSAGYFIGNGALYAKHMQDMLFVRHLWSHLRMATNEIFGGRALDAALGLTYRRLLCFTLIGMAIYWFSKFRKI